MDTMRTLRERRKLSLREVADLGGVAFSTVSKVERGLMNPRSAVTAKLARALDVPIATMRAVLAETSREASMAMRSLEKAGTR